MKNAVKDDFGYISGRGISKYWGVSKQQTPACGPDPWVVKFADTFVPSGAKNRYHMFTAENFTLTEIEAATIACYFYENRLPIHQYPVNVYFEFGEKRKCFYRVNTRSKKIEMSYFPYAATMSQPESALVSVEESQTTMLEDLRSISDEVEVQETDYDRGFAEGFMLREIIERRLGKKALKSVMKSIQKRLEEE